MNNNNHPNKFSGMIGDNNSNHIMGSSHTSFPHNGNYNLFSDSDRNHILSSQPIPVHQDTLNSFLPNDL